MSLCFDCGKVNKDDALKEATDAAKKSAIASGVAKAVYKEGNDYLFMPAIEAINNNMPVITIATPYQ